MYCRETPSVVTCSASYRAWTPKTLPVRRWQARQWQIETRIGSPSAVSRSCSQLHTACRVLTNGIVDRVGSRDIRITGAALDAVRWWPAGAAVISGQLKPGDPGVSRPAPGATRVPIPPGHRLHVEVALIAGASASLRGACVGFG